MHHRLEMIIPPTDDVESVVAGVMAPFSEHDDSEDASSFKFWDYYEIGGRYAGRKLEQSVSQDKIDAFQKELNNRHVTVSGFVWGKQELQPASQIPMVDALWREMCPGGGDVCPMFKHSGDSLNMDICRLQDMPEACTAIAVIIAAPSFDGKKMEACYMIHDSIWNGVMHVESNWDKTVKSALQNHLDRIKNYAEAYRERCTPKPDWLVVTIDYHS